MPKLLELRDDAFQQSSKAHARIRHELDVFKNEGYEAGTRVGAAVSLVDASLMPQIQTGCIRMIPAFREQISKISVEPDTENPTVQDILHIENMQNWNDMYEEVDDEANRMRSHIYWNLVAGNTISKVRWDPEMKLVRCESINPTSFAPDPSCTQSKFSDAKYVCQYNMHTIRHLKKYYEDWTPKRKEYNYRGKHRGYDQHHRVDEMWLNRDIADDCGINVKDTRREVIKVVLIDDELHKAQPSPYWYPGFPFAHWRNFLDLQHDGKAHSFWGYGYGTLAWPQQKMLDEFMANFLLMVRNLGVGRFIAKDGAIDEDQILPIMGNIIRMNDVTGSITDNLQHLPPEQIPSVFSEFITFISGIMTNMMPSLSEVFAGDAPYSGASGRAVASLQFANFNQLSDNIREMNEFRVRRQHIKYTILQQFARKPLRPHLWRGGLDLHDPFPEEARHIGFKLSTPDLTSLPNTPAGKLQILQTLMAMGIQPKDPLNLLGISKAYGWSQDDFTIIPPQALDPNATNADVATGREPNMSAER